MPRTRIYRTEERNNELWNAYLKLVEDHIALKEEHGSAVGSLSAGEIWDTLADQFFITPKTVQIIISRKLKKSDGSIKRHIQAISGRK